MGGGEESSNLRGLGQVGTITNIICIDKIKLEQNNKKYCLFPTLSIYIPIKGTHIRAIILGTEIILDAESSLT